MKISNLIYFFFGNAAQNAGQCSYGVTQANCTGTVVNPAVVQQGVGSGAGRQSFQAEVRHRKLCPPIFGLGDVEVSSRAGGTGRVVLPQQVQAHGAAAGPSIQARAHGTYTPVPAVGRGQVVLACAQAHASGSYDRSRWNRIEAEDELLELLEVA